MPQIIIDATQEYEQEHGPWGGVERLEFDCFNPNHLETTKQRWQIDGGAIWAPYAVEVEQNEHDIIIIYAEEHGQHLFEEPYHCEDGDIQWGTHVLHNVIPGAHHGPSTWNNQPGPGWTIEQPGGGQQNRRRATIWALQRDDQSAFRRQLLELDGSCAISGEDCQNALEAAHIVPAHEGGREVLSNGILLRADLHRLYDAVPRRFAICPETGQIVMAEGCDYGGFDLNECQIEEAIRQRVSEALDQVW